MNDCLAVELVPTAIGDVGASSVRFLVYAPAEKISGSKLPAVRAHDSHGHVPIGVIHDVSHSILTEWVADVAVGVPVLPG